MADFRKLLVWQKAHALAVRVTPLLPRIRRVSRRLADQIERSSESIGEAIAEGRGRATDKDFASFVTTAIASANELEHQLQRALELGGLTPEEHDPAAAATIEVRRMLIGLRKRLRGE